MSEVETTEVSKKRWYVLQAFSGFENRVAVTLREYIKLHKMEDQFGEVLVPTEEIIENVGGKRRKTERKFFPGYVLVEMEMNDYTWQLVRSVPHVMGFIAGTADKQHQFQEKKQIEFLTVFKKRQKNHVIVTNTSLAKVCVLRKVHLQTLAVRWKKWITKKDALRCLYQSSDVQRLLSLN